MRGLLWIIALFLFILLAAMIYSAVRAGAMPVA
jgi:hypothetical protein